MRFNQNFSVSLLCVALLSANSAFAFDDLFAKIDYSTWARYAQSLKTCTPNTFVVPSLTSLATLRMHIAQNPGAMTDAQIQDKINQANITIQIIGMDADRCRVTELIKMKTDSGVASTSVTTTTSTTTNPNGDKVITQSSTGPVVTASVTTPTPSMNNDITQKIDCAFYIADLPILANSAMNTAMGQLTSAEDEEVDKIGDASCSAPKMFDNSQTTGVLPTITP